MNVNLMFAVNAILNVSIVKKFKGESLTLPNYLEDLYQHTTPLPFHNILDLSLPVFPQPSPINNKLYVMVLALRSLEKQKEHVKEVSKP